MLDDSALGVTPHPHFPDMYAMNRPVVPYNTVAGVFVLLPNSFVIYHFWRKYRKFVPAMYLLLATLDSLVVLTMFCKDATMELALYPIDEAGNEDTAAVNPLEMTGSDGNAAMYPLEEAGNKGTAARLWAAIVLSSLNGILFRLSVFTYMMFSVARTVAIARPFRRIGLRSSLCSLGGCLLFWVLVTAVDFQLIQSSVQDRDYLKVDDYIMHSTNGRQIADRLKSKIGELGDIVLLILAFLAPVLVSSVACCILLYNVRNGTPKNSSSTHYQHAFSLNIRHVSVTVIWLTALFLVRILSTRSTNSSLSIIPYSLLSINLDNLI